MNQFSKISIPGKLSILSVIPLLSCSTTDQNQEKPNILFIFADDLGYAELGCYGQGLIETPHIDALAQKGKLFTNAYSTSPVSASSRCGLLTGLHMGHAYIRGNDEWLEKGDVWNYVKVSNDPNLEGQRPIPANSITIPKLLKQQGYATGCFGKWGIGAPFSEGVPEKQGFDIFFGFNCQRQAHSYFPNHLWRNDRRVELRNEIIPPGTKLPEGVDIYDEKNYERFFQQDYSAEIIFNESLAFIEENAGNPFFLYYSTTLPHKPIQAPKRLVDKYVKKFGDEEPYTGGSYYPCRYPRATYAAMVSYFDEQVGQMVAKLKELGIYENTLIIVTSDNGPGYDSEHFQSAKPFSSKGGRVKGSLYEGGIRSPFIAVWENKIPAGTTSDFPFALYDMMATFCDASNAPIPKETDGVSILPELTGKGIQVQHEYLYWEYPQSGGQQAVRYGDWKALRLNINKEGNTRIKLFNLAEDIGETTDVADQYPEIVKKMEHFMTTSRTKPQLESFYLSIFDKLPNFSFNFKSPAELQEFLRYDTQFPPYVHAHRGGGYTHYPENAIETYEYTLQRTPVFMEIDPRVTKDGVLVVLHDATLDRTTNASGKLKDYTYKEIQQFFLKDKEGNITNFKIPTLAETFRWAKGRTVLIIDKKDAPLEEVLPLIKKEKMEPYVILMAYTLDDAEKILAFDPTLTLQVFAKDKKALDAIIQKGIPLNNIVAFVGHEYPEDEEIFDLLHQKNIKGIVGSSRNLDMKYAKGEKTVYADLLSKKVDIIEADSAIQTGEELLPLLLNNTKVDKYLKYNK